MSNMTGGKSGSRKRVYDDEEDTSTLSSSRVEALEEEIERVTMVNEALIEENEKLKTLWEKEKKEKEKDAPGLSKSQSINNMTSTVQNNA
mgnify:CR=1 FL=1